MPRKPKRPCSHPGCPELVDGRFCKKHEKNTTETMKNIKEILKRISVMEKHGELLEKDM